MASATTCASSPPSAHPDSSSSDGPPELVILEWQEIVANETSDKVLKALDSALGSGGIGLVAIRNVPGFMQAKQAFLPQAHSLIKLPHEYLEKDLADAESLYNAGWSHGKEKLGDKPDFAKGSFYYNPITDLPGTPQDRASYPLSYPKNLWPDKSKLPCFKDDAIRIGRLLKEAVVELSKHIDALALQKMPCYPPQFLYKAMKDTDKVKARLLYYFPLKEEDGTDCHGAPIPPSQDSWIGWHNDSGFLTALAGDFYVNHDSGQVMNCPDPLAGLYVVDRNDVCQRVTLPLDCLAVQIGECTQIVTGGAVVATPHCVRGVTSGAASRNVARISLPCFVDTPPALALCVPPTSSRQAVLSAGLQSKRVPPLATRWKENGMTFGDFLQTTFSTYYEWNKP